MIGWVARPESSKGVDFFHALRKASGTCHATQRKLERSSGRRCSDGRKIVNSSSRAVTSNRRSFLRCAWRLFVEDSHPSRGLIRLGRQQVGQRGGIVQASEDGFDDHRKTRMKTFAQRGFVPLTGEDAVEDAGCRFAF